MRADRPLYLPADQLMPVAEAALARGQRVRLTATGCSMLPLLRPGDVVELAPLEGLPVLGWVVLARGPHGYVLHRVRRVEGEQIWTQGDATRRADPPVAVKNMLGRVVEVERGGRSLGDLTGRWRLAGRLWQAAQPVSGWALATALAARRASRPSTAPAELATLVAALRVDQPLLSDDPLVAWPAVVALAQRQGVVALLHERLNAVGLLEHLPAPTVTDLRRAALANLARNSRMMAELANVLAALHSAGVPVIVHKGGYLAGAVYATMASRAVGDLDLVVPRRRLGTAARVLADLGYDLRGWQRAGCPDIGRLPSLSRCGGAVIDVHWSTAHPSRSTAHLVQQLWDTSRSVTVAGQPARALSAEELVLGLTEHWALAHGLSTDLRGLVDIATVIAREPEIDWPLMLRLAAERDWTAALSLSLHAAHEWLGAAVPSEVLSALPTPPKLEMVASSLLGDLPHSLTTGQTRPSDWVAARRSAALVHLAGREGRHRWRHGIRFGWQRYAPLLGRWLAGDPTLRSAWRAQLARDEWLQRN